MRWTVRPRAGVGVFAVTPVIPIAIALVLLAASIILGVQNEQGRLAERVRGTKVQAAVFARSVAAPLAFEDVATIEEYLTALKANASIRAAGAYRLEGARAAGFVRPGETLPLRVAAASAGPVRDEIVVATPVVQNGTRLGWVYLSVATETWPRRAARYAGIALVLIMASLLIAVLGVAYGSLSRTHRRLNAEIAQREAAEEALRQAQKMEAMGQLTGGVAHDFNNLLMVASSGLDLLDRTSDPDRRERLKQGIRQAIDRGAKLTQQLLTFARKSPLKPEVIDVERTIRGLQDMLERSLRENITVEMRFAPDLCPIEVDASQFEVALLNVALNARDAMVGGGVIRIAVDRLPAEGEGEPMIRVAVSDSGAGVAPENLQKVFEPFFTTKGVGHGTGLGLSQVYGLARSSGGDVRIESELGVGTTISILMPCSDKALQRRAAGGESLAVVRRKCRVLLVEDDDQVAELVGEMLGELGYDHFRAASAAEALERVAGTRRFDLVFSDMVMPGGMGGLDLARELAVREPNLKLILTTGYSEAAASAIAEGHTVLSKPYSIEDLSRVLEEVFGSR